MYKSIRYTNEEEFVNVKTEQQTENDKSSV